MEQYVQEKKSILIVDDDFINRQLLIHIFSDEYCFLEAENGEEGLRKIEKYQRELCAILLDVNMPGMNGMKLLNILYQRGITQRIPVFLITVHDEEEMVQQSYNLGVMDVINKPVTPCVILRRVQSVIELFQSRESLSKIVRGQERQLSENQNTIHELNRGMIEALAAAIEFRDVESGEHVARIHDITKYVLANTSLGDDFTPEEIDSIATAAILHDVGKIAIPDRILNKPGRLTPQEYTIMKQHSEKGAELLEKIPQLREHPTYRYASDIARHHHERWDGNGYPDGLQGDEISIWSQVVSIADVYDALLSERVYKEAFSPEQALKMIQAGECGIFNPKLLQNFWQVEPEIRKWYAPKDRQRS